MTLSEHYLLRWMKKWIRSEKLKDWKCFVFERTLGRFSEFLKREMIKVFQTSVWTIYIHFANLSKVTQLQSGTILRIQLSTQVENPWSRSNLTIHPRALINGSSSSNVRMRSTILMTPWKHKLRTLLRH